MLQESTRERANLRPLPVMWTGFEEGLASPLNRIPRTSLLTLPLASPPRACAHPECGALWR
eukprot:4787428-Prymnesium_polylepis.1